MEVRSVKDLESCASECQWGCLSFCQSRERKAGSKEKELGNEEMKEMKEMNEREKVHA